MYRNVSQLLDLDPRADLRDRDSVIAAVAALAELVAADLRAGRPVSPAAVRAADAIMTALGDEAITNPDEARRARVVVADLRAGGEPILAVDRIIDRGIYLAWTSGRPGGAAWSQPVRAARLRPARAVPALTA